MYKFRKIHTKNELNKIALDLKTKAESMMKTQTEGRLEMKTIRHLSRNYRVKVHQQHSGYGRKKISGIEDLIEKRWIYLSNKNDIMKYSGKWMKIEKLILREVTYKHSMNSLISEYWMLREEE